MSTSIAAKAWRPSSSSDGRSGTCSNGARVNAIGNVDASGTQADQRAGSGVVDGDAVTNRSPQSASGFHPAFSSEAGRCGTWS